MYPDSEVPRSARPLAYVFGDETQLMLPDADIVVIGASLGGPDALRQFFSVLTMPLSCAILIVQHIQAGFDRMLAAQLDKVGAMGVNSLDQAPLEASSACLLAPDRELRAVGGNVMLCSHSRRSPFRPCIDQSIRSLSAISTRPVHLILLSGMSSDGREAARLCRANEAQVWLQSPDSCAATSMVDCAAEQANFVGSPTALAEALTKHYGATA